MRKSNSDLSPYQASVKFISQTSSIVVSTAQMSEWLEALPSQCRGEVYHFLSGEEVTSEYFAWLDIKRDDAIKAVFEKQPYVNNSGQVFERLTDWVRSEIQTAYVSRAMVEKLGSIDKKQPPFLSIYNEMKTLACDEEEAIMRAVTQVPPDKDFIDNMAKLIFNKGSLEVSGFRDKVSRSVKQKWGFDSFLKMARDKIGLAQKNQKTPPAKVMPKILETLDQHVEQPAKSDVPQDFKVERKKRKKQGDQGQNGSGVKFGSVPSTPTKRSSQNGGFLTPPMSPSNCKPAPKKLNFDFIKDEKQEEIESDVVEKEENVAPEVRAYPHWAPLSFTEDAKGKIPYSREALVALREFIAGVSPGEKLLPEIGKPFNYTKNANGLLSESDLRDLTSTFGNIDTASFQDFQAAIWGDQSPWENLTFQDVSFQDNATGRPDARDIQLFDYFVGLLKSNDADTQDTFNRLFDALDQHVMCLKRKGDFVLARDAQETIAFMRGVHAWQVEFALSDEDIKALPDFFRGARGKNQFSYGLQHVLQKHEQTLPLRRHQLWFRAHGQEIERAYEHLQQALDARNTFNATEFESQLKALYNIDGNNRRLSAYDWYYGTAELKGLAYFQAQLLTLEANVKAYYQAAQTLEALLEPYQVGQVFLSPLAFRYEHDLKKINTLRERLNAHLGKMDFTVDGVAKLYDSVVSNKGRFNQMKKGERVQSGKITSAKTLNDAFLKHMSGFAPCVYENWLAFAEYDRNKSQGKHFYNKPSKKRDLQLKGLYELSFQMANGKQTPSKYIDLLYRDSERISAGRLRDAVIQARKQAQLFYARSSVSSVKGKINDFLHHLHLYEARVRERRFYQFTDRKRTKQLKMLWDWTCELLDGKQSVPVYLGKLNTLMAQLQQSSALRVTVANAFKAIGQAYNGHLGSVLRDADIEGMGQLPKGKHYIHFYVAQIDDYVKTLHTKKWPAEKIAAMDVAIEALAKKNDLKENEHKRLARHNQLASCLDALLNGGPIANPLKGSAHTQGSAQIRIQNLHARLEARAVSDAAFIKRFSAQNGFARLFDWVAHSGADLSDAAQALRAWMESAVLTLVSSAVRESKDLNEFLGSLDKLIKANQDLFDNLSEAGQKSVLQQLDQQVFAALKANKNDDAYLWRMLESEPIQVRFSNKSHCFPRVEQENVIAFFQGFIFRRVLGAQNGKDYESIRGQLVRLGESQNELLKSVLAASETDLASPEIGIPACVTRFIVMYRKGGGLLNNLKTQIEGKEVLLSHGEKTFTFWDGFFIYLPAVLNGTPEDRKAALDFLNVAPEWARYLPLQSEALAAFSQACLKQAIDKDDFQFIREILNRGYLIKLSEQQIYGTPEEIFHLFHELEVPPERLGQVLSNEQIEQLIQKKGWQHAYGKFMLENTFVNDWVLVLGKIKVLSGNQYDDFLADCWTGFLQDDTLWQDEENSEYDQMLSALFPDTFSVRDWQSRLSESMKLSLETAVQERASKVLGDCFAYARDPRTHEHPGTMPSKKAKQLLLDLTVASEQWVLPDKQRSQYLFICQGFASTFNDQPLGLVPSAGIKFDELWMTVLFTSGANRAALIEFRLAKKGDISTFWGKLSTFIREKVFAKNLVELLDDPEALIKLYDEMHALWEAMTLEQIIQNGRKQPGEEAFSSLCEYEAEKDKPEISIGIKTRICTAPHSDTLKQYFTDLLCGKHVGAARFAQDYFDGDGALLDKIVEYVLTDDLLLTEGLLKTLLDSGKLSKVISQEVDGHLKFIAAYRILADALQDREVALTQRNAALHDFESVRRDKINADQGIETLQRELTVKLDAFVGAKSIDMADDKLLFVLRLGLIEIQLDAFAYEQKDKVIMKLKVCMKNFKHTYNTAPFFFCALRWLQSDRNSKGCLDAMLMEYVQAYVCDQLDKGMSREPTFDHAELVQLFKGPVFSNEYPDLDVTQKQPAEIFKYILEQQGKSLGKALIAEYVGELNWPMLRVLMSAYPLQHAQIVDWTVSAIRESKHVEEAALASLRDSKLLALLKDKCEAKQKDQVDNLTQQLNGRLFCYAVYRVLDGLSGNESALQFSFDFRDAPELKVNKKDRSAIETAIKEVGKSLGEPAQPVLSSLSSLVKVCECPDKRVEHVEALNEQLEAWCQSKPQKKQNLIGSFFGGFLNKPQATATVQPDTKQNLQK